MSASSPNIEQQFFRRLNGIVEPLVRRGVGSPKYAPASLIVLETRGFKSGLQRRTPLWSLKLGRYRLISTARGKLSFWVKNLEKESRATYYVGGKQRSIEAIVVKSGAQEATGSLPAWLRRLTGALERYTERGWTFAILVPQTR
jgi:deazaflavin-dependent oxidoreductase (nitroreductase family)